MSSGSTTQIHFKRIYFVAFALLLFWVILEIRLFDIQVRQHEFYVRHSRLRKRSIWRPAGA